MEEDQRKLSGLGSHDAHSFEDICTAKQLLNGGGGGTVSEEEKDAVATERKKQRLLDGTLIQSTRMVLQMRVI